jgi:CheY-like chemotaxis protein
LLFIGASLIWEMSGPKRILVVDDTEDGLFLISRSLKRTFPKAEILFARDGSEALSVLTRAPVDAVITDNRMAEMSGLELTQAIRATGSLIPILMLTGSEELEEKALKAGVTVFHPSSRWADIGDALQRCWSVQGCD